jgi:hypothetical protein
MRRLDGNYGGHALSDEHARTQRAFAYLKQPGPYHVRRRLVTNLYSCCTNVMKQKSYVSRIKLLDTVLEAIEEKEKKNLPEQIYI